MNINKVDLSFQSCNADYAEADVVIFSCPMDSTTSFRPGARFAGNAIRVDSAGIEWYSPYRKRSLKQFKTADIGDLSLPIGDVETALALIHEATAKVISDGKKPMVIGGEHLITYPVVKALHERYPTLHLIHLDAHTDSRDEFFGMRFSHATVIKRCHDLLGDGRIFQFGIRSGDESEFAWAASGHTMLQPFNLDGLADAIAKIGDQPVYITIDLDVLDPSVFPGTGTPEAGGITYRELLEALDEFSAIRNIVGADIVELAPLLDPSGTSTAVAVKTLRELVLLLHK